MVKERRYWRRRPDGTIQYWGEHTRTKYRILGKYLYSLSLIVGKEGWAHYFIDACAGSGRVYIPPSNPSSTMLHYLTDSCSRCSFLLATRKLTLSSSIRSLTLFGELRGG